MYSALCTYFYLRFAGWEIHNSCKRQTIKTFLLLVVILWYHELALILIQEVIVIAAGNCLLRQSHSSSSQIPLSKNWNPFQGLKSPFPRIASRVQRFYSRPAKLPLRAGISYLQLDLSGQWSVGANVVFEKRGGERWRRFHQTIMGEV